MTKEILSAARHDFHAALQERLWSVRGGVSDDKWGDAHEMLAIMVEGKRLRDVSDLPLDLAV